MADKEKRKQRRTQLRIARNDAFFWAYYEMGADRSLRKLREFVCKMGGRISENSLFRYSSDFGWQARILEIDSKLQADKEASHLAKIQSMNERQAQDARNLQAIGRAGMTGLVNIMKATGQLDMSPQDIVTLIREGAKLERLAVGEVTDRTEAVVLVYNVMLLGIAEIFKEVYQIKDREQMLRAFAQRIDEFRDKKLIEITGKQGE